MQITAENNSSYVSGTYPSYLDGKNTVISVEIVYDHNAVNDMFYIREVTGRMG